MGEPPHGYPSITLGVFELTPLEVAQAYTLFLNDGNVRPLRSIARIQADKQSVTPPEGKMASVASPQSAFLVTNMMRSVLNEGTGGGARGMGFTRDAAGKTGTTNDLRDAWFVGFTPELLTVVWVGFDDNQPLGLSGGRAALPIWVDFMKAALAGRPATTFQVTERHHLGRDRPGNRQAGAPRVPVGVQRGVRRGHRAHGALPAQPRRHRRGPAARVRPRHRAVGGLRQRAVARRRLQPLALGL